MQQSLVQDSPLLPALQIHPAPEFTEQLPHIVDSDQETSSDAEPRVQE